MDVILSVINADICHCAEHEHTCLELVYRLCGSSDTAIGKHTHHISEGDFYIVPPNISHSDTAQDSFSDLVIHIKELALAKPLILHDYDGFVYSIAQLINRVINKKENNYKAIANGLADTLFKYIKLFPLSLEPNNVVLKLKNIIFENVENPEFNLTKEIENLNYDPDYIRRCFKAETTKTPLAYLTDLRIDRARQLLALPTCESIETISVKCGFRDSFYFSTCFKKHTGLSPLQYRKTNQAKR